MFDVLNHADGATCNVVELGVQNKVELHMSSLLELNAVKLHWCLSYAGCGKLQQSSKHVP